MLQSIVLATLPACVGDVGVAGTGQDGCLRSVSHTFSFETPSDPPLELRVESCRVDADACKRLCEMLMQRAGLGLAQSCDVQFQQDEVTATTTYFEPASNVGCGGNVGEGRRPAGLAQPRTILATSAVGHWLAHAAWLEAASVPAFVYLARELDAFGAPRGLARLALAAARDEIRHTQMMTALAHRFGGRRPAVEVAAPAARSLEAFAIENAIEGCVRETWGALVATWQAQRSTDRELRATFAEIAIDEARHAALAWAVDSWASTRLDTAAQARVIEARRAAVAALVATELGGTPFDRHALAILGLPDVPAVRGLTRRAQRALWQGGAA